MKKHLVMLMSCLMMLAVSVSAFAEKKKGKETVKFFIEELDCPSCVKKIEKNIAFEKGVTDIKCDLKERTVDVTFKTDKTSKAKLISAFKKLELPAVEVDKDATCTRPTEKATCCPGHDHKEDTSKTKKEHKH